MSEAERNSVAIWNMMREVENGRKYKSLLESIKERLAQSGCQNVYVIFSVMEDIDKTLKGKE
jgi:hypothetical protein